MNASAIPTLTRTSEGDLEEVWRENARKVVFNKLNKEMRKFSKKIC